MSTCTFKKAERLKSRKIIGKLFSDGQSFGMYPLRLVWLEMHEIQGDFPVKFSLSVPKRAFPKAVDRNQLRRLVREAWRLNKSWLYDRTKDDGKQYAFMVIYTAREPMKLPKIEESMRRMSRRFLKKRNEIQSSNNQKR
ncbi:MAG: ribonuclease P protein component [Paraglaciecola sp.]|jgi:ribonuclease P protein component